MMADRFQGRGLPGLLPLLRGCRGVLVRALLAGLLAQGGGVAVLAAGAWLAGMAVAGDTAGNGLVPGIALLAGIVVATAGLRWWQSQQSHDLAFALIETLQIGLFDGLERSAPGFVQGRRSGDLAAAATADAAAMEHFFAHMLADCAGAVLVPLAAVAGLAVIEPWLAVALLPFPPLVAAVPLWLGRRADDAGRAMAAASARLNAETVEAIQGQRELALFGGWPAARERLADAAARLATARRHHRRHTGLEQAAVDALAAVALAAVALAAALLPAGSRVGPEVLPLALVLAGGTLLPLADLAQAARRLGELRAGAARLQEILHQPAAVADHGRFPPPGDATIRFEAVRFGYDGGGVPVLDGVSFIVRPGERVALVGRSGEGKSSCASLLLRLRDVQGGRVTIGGRDVRDLPLAALRRLVACVPQETHLFNDGIGANIRLGRPDAGPDAVERAAALAGVAGVIAGLPRGYDTPCGDGGACLSGGQRQRVTIARALLMDAPVLILDEPSSGLDTGHEDILRAALETVRRDRAVLVITHRLSSLARDADRVLVLSGGRIVESGPPAELLARGGVYAGLAAAEEAEA